MIWIIILILVLATIYYETHRSLSYWKLKGVPYEKPIPIFGNFIDVILRREQLGYVLKRSYDKYDKNTPYFGIYIFHTPNLVIRSREMIKRVLIKDFSYFINRSQYTNEKVDPLLANVLFSLKNEEWKSLRSRIHPVFTIGKLKKMFLLIKEVSNELQNLLEDANGKEIDVRDLSRAYAIDAICTCAFGMNCQSLKDRNNIVKVMVNKLLDQTGFIRSLSMFSWFFCPMLVNIFRLTFADLEASEYLAGIFKDTTKERKKSKVKRHDLIDILLETQEDAKLGNIYNLEDDDRISAQAIVFFNAGAEPTSTLLYLANYEMAMNPDIQVKVRKEIIDTIREDGDLSYDSLSKMEYLDSVMKETLRKYPITQFLTRYAEKDYLFEETGLKIEKGTKILVPIMAVHYNPEYYPDPEKFDPERFQGDRMKNLQYVYFPFGDGPRRCIGERFAIMSAKLGFATFLKEYEVLQGEKTEKPIQANKAALFFTPKNERVFLKIRKIS